MTDNSEALLRAARAIDRKLSEDLAVPANALVWSAPGGCSNFALNLAKEIAQLTRPSSPAASDGDAVERMARALHQDYCDDTGCNKERDWDKLEQYQRESYMRSGARVAQHYAALSAMPLPSPVSDGGACPKCARGSLTLSSCNECGTRFNVAQSFKAMELSDDVDILLKSADILADELSVLRHTTGISDRARAALADYDASAFKLRRVIRAAKQGAR